MAYTVTSAASGGRELAKGMGAEGLDFALMRVASTRKLLRLPYSPLEDSDDMRFSPFNVISYGLSSDVQRRDNFIRILCVRALATSMYHI